MPTFVLVLLAAVVVIVVLVHVLRSGPSEPAFYAARPALTPGGLNPDVTQATIGSTICRHGWTRTIRPPIEYTDDLKHRQMRAYREAGPPSAYQEDHLISLELGGNPTDPRNLWPEPYPRASDVDKIENELNDEVCSGRLSLREAQRREAELKYRDG